jgi:hypothetical protein
MTSKKPTKKTTSKTSKTSKKAAPKKKAAAKKPAAKKAPAKKTVEEPKYFAQTEELLANLVDDIKDNVIYAADVKTPALKKKFFAWFRR